MIALTQKDVLAHQVLVPWSEPYQVSSRLGGRTAKSRNSTSETTFRLAVIQKWA
jgi:hypothetical protein